MVRGGLEILLLALLSVLFAPVLDSANGVSGLKGGLGRISALSQNVGLL